MRGFGSATFSSPPSLLSPRLLPELHFHLRSRRIQSYKHRRRRSQAQDTWLANLPLRATHITLLTQHHQRSYAFIKVQQGRTNTIAGLFPSVKSPLQKDPWKLRCIFGVFLQHVGCAAWILLDHVGPICRKKGWTLWIFMTLSDYNPRHDIPRSFQQVASLSKKYFMWIRPLLNWYHSRISSLRSKWSQSFPRMIFRIY